MRKELSQMEIIEKYLNDELSQTEKADFEKKLATDKNLQNEVQLQKQLLHGIKRNAIKQIATKIYTKNNFMKKFKKWGFGGLGATIIICSVLIFNHYFTAQKESPNNIIQKDIHTEKNGTIVSANSNFSDTIDGYSQDITDSKSSRRIKLFSTEYLKTQKFIIKGNVDTILKSLGGVQMKIEKNTFVDKFGNPVSEAITIEYKEAIKSSDILFADLTTTTNGKALESGGMLYINASESGNKLAIAKNKTISAKVPTKQIKKGMQLFEGELNESNNINWKNPKPLSNNNKTIDLNNEPVFGDMLNDSVGFEQNNAVVLVSKSTNWKDTVKNLNAKNVNNNNFKTKNVIIPKNYVPTGQNFFIEDSQTNYIISIGKLGWANIDRLATDTRTKQIELITKVENKKEFEYIYSRIMFPNKNMYIPGYEKKDGTYSFTHGDYEATRLPVGETAIIVASTNIGEKTFFGIKKIIIEEKQEVILTLKETEEPEIKKIILEYMSEKSDTKK